MTARDDVMDGSAWRTFCRQLEHAGEIVLSADAAANELDRAEGYRYLTRLLRIALEMQLEFADPDFPGFYRASHQTAKIGADNPDNDYLNAALNPTRRYIISGVRGTVPILTFGTKANRYAIDGTMASTGELDAKDLAIAPDGGFEIIVSNENPGSGNWLPMAPDTSFLVVRQTFSDRGKQTANRLTIKALDGPPTPTPLSAATLAQALTRTAGFVEGTAKTFANWAEDFRVHQLNKLATTDQSLFQRAGGDPTIFYLHGYWQLAPDQALVIETDIPSCRTWNFQLNNYWMESLDYRYHRIHVNDTTAARDPDGQVTIVVAARNPGFGNWLDTAGHTQGTMLLRWTGATEHPIPKTHVIKI